MGLSHNFKLPNSTMQIEFINCKDDADCNWGDTISDIKAGSP